MREKITDRNSPLFDFDDWSSSCNRKNGYDTEWQAKFAAEETSQKSRDKIKLNWYFCDYCGKFHLTSI